jgi:hypothetical protein
VDSTSPAADPAPVGTAAGVPSVSILCLSSYIDPSVVSAFNELNDARATRPVSASSFPRNGDVPPDSHCPLCLGDIGLDPPSSDPRRVGCGLSHRSIASSRSASSASSSPESNARVFDWKASSRR